MTVHMDQRRHTLQFRGGWLIAARVVWIVLVGLPLAGFIAGLPVYVEQLRTLSGISLLGTFSDMYWTTATLRAALAEAGLPAWSYEGLRAGLNQLVTAVYLTTALILYIRSGHEWIGWYTALMLALVGFAQTQVITAFAMTSAVAATLSRAVLIVGWVSFYVFMFIFPDGRVRPRWMIWVVLLIAFVLPLMIARTSGFMNRPIAGPTILALFAAGGYSQIYRYTRVSGHVERLQTRWLITSIIVMGSTILLAGFIIPNFIPAAADPGPARLILLMIQSGLFAIVFITVPVALGIAIQRYHLWNIDVIIRRTLIYALITLTLAGVYYGTVVLLQAAFVRLTGQDSPITVVASTLLIAALFSPVRRRVQRFIDRRFYRRKYDLTRTVDEFASTLYEEVDIERLSESLVGVVDKTMKPQHVSLWVQEPNE